VARNIHTFTRWTRRRLPKLPDDVLPEGPVAYLDIETTGLSPASAQITLVGLAWGDKGGRRLRQYFVDRPRSEPGVLRAVAANLSKFAGTVTYNGGSFDLPFLRRRARAHGIRWPWIETFDLLGVARAWRRTHGRPDDCRLKTVMSHFRVGRTDDTTGYEMVEAYWRWLDTGDSDERELILEHNAQDVMLLPDIVPHLLRQRAGKKRPRR
jgi:uncharacterized protein